MGELREIRAKRNELMNTIQTLVRVFEMDTSVQVTKLDVWHDYDVEEHQDVALVSVTLEL